jgi:serine/threonine protein phosphatase PrpC
MRTRPFRATWAIPRLYQFQAGRIAYQTRDHSVLGALAASGSIRDEEIRFHEDRSRLLRSLGNDGAVSASIEKRSYEADLTTLHANGGTTLSGV